MPISQDRVLAILRAADRCLSVIDAIKGIAVYELRADPNNLIARQLQETLLFNHTLIEDITMIKIEMSHFTPNRVRQNEKAADRQRRHRLRRSIQQTDSDEIAINEFTSEISGKLGPETRAFLESKGVKVKTPDHYDKLATEHNASIMPATPPHPQAHKFRDDLHDVPSSEDELFAEPNDGET